LSLFVIDYGPGTNALAHYYETPNHYDGDDDGEDFRTAS
jgi:hypothetical protein